MQCVGNFVTHQHVIECVAHVFPDRQAQGALVGIEVRSLGIGTMLDVDILACHSTGEDVFGSGLHGSEVLNHHPYCTINGDHIKG